MSPYGNKPDLSNSVRTHREKMGLTQEELAGITNLSRQSIIAIEKGRFTPSIHTALMLAAALGTNIEELFRLEKEDEE